MLDWSHFNEIEPIGPRGDDLRLSVIAQLLGNQHRQKHDPILDADDFFPWMALAPANEHGIIELDPDEQVAMFDRVFGR